LGRATGQAYKATEVEAKLSHIIPTHPASSLIITDHPTYESNTIYYKGFDKNAVQQLCLEVYALHGQGTDLVLPPRAGRVVTCPSESLNSNATLAYGFRMSNINQPGSSSQIGLEKLGESAARKET
jgi:hypothetical protein